ncbi:unnamed protein product, partial [Chrysoparadoxa australica]
SPPHGLVTPLKPFIPCLARRFRMSTPLPWKPILVACLAISCQAYAVLNILPYIGYQVVFMNEGAGASSESLDGAGRYAGPLTAAAMLGRLTTALPWGFASRSRGPRSLVLLQLCAMCVLQPLYGIVNDVPVAGVVRYLLGCLMAVNICVNSWTASLEDPVHRQTTLSYMTGSWTVGATLAPALGGFLAEPASKYSVFRNSDTFIRYPYLLPGLVGSGQAFITAVLCLLWLPERKRQDTSKEELQAAPSGVTELREVSAVGSVASALSPVNMAGIGGRRSKLPWQGDEEEEPDGLKRDSAMVEIWRVGCQMVSTRDGRINVFAFIIVSIVWMTFEEAASLVSIATLDAGGFGWNEKRTGLLLSAWGLSGGLWQFLVLPKAMARWGPNRVQLAVCLVALPAVVTLPATPFISAQVGPGLGFASATFVGAIVSICVNTVTTTLMLHLFGASDDLGVVSGYMFFINSGFIALGSFLGGYLSSFALEG